MAEDPQIATLELRITTAETLLGDLVLQRDASPNDKGIAGAITAQHAKIAGYHQKISERRLALVARERSLGVSAKAARREAREKGRQGVEAVASNSLRLVSLHDTMIDSIRAFNAEFDAVRQERREAFLALLRSCGPHRSDGPVKGHADALLDTGEITTAVVHGLVIEAGLGRQGAALTPWVLVTTPSSLSSQRWTWAAALERANKRMLAGATEAADRAERIEREKE